jgi:predicted dehydrogenase
MSHITPAMTPRAVSTRGADPASLTSFAIVGSGWRSSVFLRLGYLLPERFRVTGVMTHRAESAQAVERDWGLSTHRSLDELLAHGRPDFVVVSVPWPVTPVMIRDLVSRGVSVLAETPPAPDLDGMRSLWADVGASGLVQVAEQYALMPLHAARLTAVREGVIGLPTSIHISSTHLYHVAAMMRAFLGVGLDPARVSSQTFTAPLVNPITPAGWTHDTSLKQARTIISTVDFGDGRMGLYDFTDNQWWNPVRPDHLMVRGSTGELSDETVVRMADELTPVTSHIERAMTGQGMNYEGLELTHLSLDGRVIFRNRFLGASLMDDDIAVAELLERTGSWARDSGEAPYPLAEAMHDHHIGLAIEESAGTGAPVELSPEPWASK